MARQKVAIVGGGIAGLTAAHELIERDFDVVLYERRQALGGKAASGRFDENNKPQLLSAGNARPGEHGFRFFPGWYRHLPDTMKRIKLGGVREHNRERSVFDHLVPVESNLLVQYDRDPIPIVLHTPKSASQAQTQFAFIRQLASIGLPLGDALDFFQRLAVFLRTPEEKRKAEYDSLSWWDFLNVPDRSDAFRTLTLATTRTLLAAKAEEASAYTIALCALRTLFDSPLRSDCVLDGPTSEIWIEPWRLYLAGKGVKFITGYELDAIEFDGKAPLIQSLRFSKSKDLVDSRRLRAILSETDAALALSTLANHLPRLDRARSEDDVIRAFQSHDQPEALGAYDDSANERQEAFEALIAAEQTSAGVLPRALRAVPEEGVEPMKARVLAACRQDVSFRLAQSPTPEKVAISRGTTTARTSLDAEDVEGDIDFYLFALPVEQMAYYVNRSTTLTSYDPSLKKLISLSASIDWMAGIQFYLQYPLKIAPGHIVCADSEWALTGIEQVQFWTDVELPSGVQSILSVDISAWDKKGRFTRKEAFLCTNDEIAREVWEQLKASFNRAGEQEVIRDSSLITGKVEDSYHLDENIFDRYDRKKQGAFARSLNRTLSRAAQPALESQELLKQAAANPDAPFVFGDRLQLNAEPLLVNRPHTLALRPTARTKIKNMFLAGDYVQTATNLACMEGANESGRRAVNAILEAARSRFAPCETWDFEGGEILTKMAAIVSFAERLPGATTSIEAATEAIGTVTSFAGRARDTLTNWWRKT